MFSEKKKASAARVLIATDQGSSPAQSGFYSKLEETLEVFGFAARFARCVPRPMKEWGGPTGH